MDANTIVASKMKDREKLLLIQAAEENGLPALTPNAADQKPFIRVWNTIKHSPIVPPPIHIFAPRSDEEDRVEAEKRQAAYDEEKRRMELIH